MSSKVAVGGYMGGGVGVGVGGWSGVGVGWAGGGGGGVGGGDAFRIAGPFVRETGMFDFYFAVNLINLLNKQSSC